MFPLGEDDAGNTPRVNHSLGYSVQSGPRQDSWSENSVARLLGDLAVKTIIKKYGIDGIWHFTDKENLESIQKQGGLLSLRVLKERGLEIPAPGGNQWSHEADEFKGLDRYVHLTFVNHHPMMYTAKQDGRIKSPVWLKIDSSILLDSGVRCCSSVANCNGSELLDHREAAEQIDFEVLFTRMDWHDPEIHNRRNAAEKSEILVPDEVPIDKILSFNNGKKTRIYTTRSA